MPKLRIVVKAKSGQTGVSPNADRARAMIAYLEKIIPRHIQDWIQTNKPFQSQTGKAIGGFKAEHTGGGTIKISNLVRYAYWLNYQIKPHQMTYLADAKKTQKMAFGKYMYWGTSAIPVAGGTFRQPSAASMLAGKWYHPGRPATLFLEKSLEALVQELNAQKTGFGFSLEV